MRPHANMIKVWADHPELKVETAPIINGKCNKLFTETVHPEWKLGSAYRFIVPRNIESSKFYRVVVKNVNECEFKIVDEKGLVWKDKIESVATYCSSVKNNEFRGQCYRVHNDEKAEISFKIDLDAALNKFAVVKFWNIEHVEELVLGGLNFGNAGVVVQIKHNDDVRMEELENKVKELEDRIKQLEDESITRVFSKTFGPF